MSEEKDSAPQDGTSDRTDIAAADMTHSIPSVSGRSSLSARQAREMAAELIKLGIPEDKVSAALASDGFTPAPEDARTESERAYDAAFGPPPSPADYRIEYIHRIPDGTDTATLAEFNTAATAWLAAMGIPALVGGGLIERAMDVGHAYEASTEAEQALWRREQVALLERLAGSPEKAAEKMALAASTLARAPKNFTDALVKSGALHDAGMVLNLALQGERLATRG